MSQGGDRSRTHGVRASRSGLRGSYSWCGVHSSPCKLEGIRVRRRGNSGDGGRQGLQVRVPGIFLEPVRTLKRLSNRRASNKPCKHLAPSARCTPQDRFSNHPANNKRCSCTPCWWARRRCLEGNAAAPDPTRHSAAGPGAGGAAGPAPHCHAARALASPAAGTGGAAKGQEGKRGTGKNRFLFKRGVIFTAQAQATPAAGTRGAARAYASKKGDGSVGKIEESTGFLNKMKLATTS